MPPYRCYFLDGANHVVKVQYYDCVDDTSARSWVATVCGQPDGQYCREIWCRDRLVERHNQVVP